jgi:hypothetical protein
MRKLGSGLLGFFGPPGDVEQGLGELPRLIWIHLDEHGDGVLLSDHVQPSHYDPHGAGAPYVDCNAALDNQSITRRSRRSPATPIDEMIRAITAPMIR